MGLLQKFKLFVVLLVEPGRTYGEGLLISHSGFIIMESLLSASFSRNYHREAQRREPHSPVHDGLSEYLGRKSVRAVI